MVTRTVFTRCIKAKPLALTPDGSNPGAHALVIRSAPEGAAQTPAHQQNSSETTEMDKAALFRSTRAVALMDEVTRAYFGGLDEEKGTAFLERTPEEQKAEAAEAKRVADAAASADAARAAGATEREIALQRELDDLKARDVARTAKDAERDMIDLSRSKDFDGFPGGEVKVLETLRSIAGLTPAQQEPTLALMRSQAEMAKKTATLLGDTKRMTEQPASDRVRTEAAERAKKSGKSVEREIVAMRHEPAWQEDFTAMHQEDAAATAA